MRTELKSNCCGADVSINGDREQFENACFYTCNTCSKPCDGVAQEMKRAGECSVGDCLPCKPAGRCVELKPSYLMVSITDYEEMVKKGIQMEAYYKKDGKECLINEHLIYKSTAGEKRDGVQVESPSTWEDDWRELCSTVIVNDDVIDVSSMEERNIKFIRTLLAEAERTAVRKCLEIVKEALPKYHACSSCCLDTYEREKEEGKKEALSEITALLDTKLKNLG